MFDFLNLTFRSYKYQLFKNFQFFFFDVFDFSKKKTIFENFWFLFCQKVSVNEESFEVETKHSFTDSTKWLSTSISFDLLLIFTVDFSHLIRVDSKTIFKPREFWLKYHPDTPSKVVFWWARSFYEIVRFSFRFPNEMVPSQTNLCGIDYAAFLISFTLFSNHPE